MSAYWIILIAMAVMAVITFVTLFRKEAGYGYLSTGKWGPVISNRIAWVIEEAPAFLLMLFYTLRYAFSGENYGNCNPVLYILAGFYLLHYFQRSFIFPFLLKGSSKMPLAIMFLSVIWNLINGYVQGYWLFHLAPMYKPYGAQWFSSWQFLLGLSIFIIGWIINMHSDYVIRHLRQPGDSNHYLPKGGLYNYVTSANYLGEITEWLGWAILTWSWAGALFFLLTCSNLVPRANSIYYRYMEEFPKEFDRKKLKRIIPFIY